MGDLREAIEQAVTAEETKVEGTAVPSSAEPSAVPAPQEPPVESEGGEAASPKPGQEPAPLAGTPAPSHQEQAPGEEARGHRVDRPPSSWRAEARFGWTDLPLAVRQEIHKRELDINKQLQDSADVRKEVDAFRQMASPYMARLQSMGANPIQAASALFQADYLLSSAPKQQRAEFMAKLIRDYDIDIQALDSALAGTVAKPGTQAAQQSDIQTIVQQSIQQAMAPFYQQQQMAAQQIQQQANTTVEQMSLDPKYPLFEEVRNEMADLMELAARRGQSLSLEDAYSRAVTFNPTYRQQQQLNGAQAANSRAQAAINASSSISGAPVGGGNTVHQSDGTLRGDIEAAITNLRM